MEFIQGNLITLFKEGKFDVIAHQANCKGIFGAGVAYHLLQEFPDLLEADKTLKKEEKPGGVSLLKTEYGYIANLYSQINLGKPSVEGTDSYIHRINLMVKALTSMFEAIPRDKIHLGIPLIASGIAADALLKMNNTDLYYFQNFVQPFVEFAAHYSDKEIKITVVYL